MPAALQVATVVLMSAKLFNAVLAVVVTQAPRIVVGSSGTGVGGSGGVGMVAEPVFFAQPIIKNKDRKKKGFYIIHSWSFCIQCTGCINGAPVGKSFADS